MSIAIALVEATARRLRYLATQDGGAGTTANIPNDGGASPDLRTDANPHRPMREIMRATVDGLGAVWLKGNVPAHTQAEARALLASDDPAKAVLTNNHVPRCRIEVMPRSGASQWSADANVDAQGDPIVVVASEAAAGEAYIDVILDHTLVD